MTTYNTTIKKRNPTNTGWDSILPITTAENVLVNGTGETVASQLIELVPNKEVTTINHNFNDYPLVYAFYTEYGAGMSGAGDNGAGGANGYSIPVKIEYMDKNSITIFAPLSSSSLDGAELIKVDDYNYIINLNNRVRSLIIKLKI